MAYYELPFSLLCAHISYLKGYSVSYGIHDSMIVVSTYLSPLSETRKALRLDSSH